MATKKKAAKKAATVCYKPIDPSLTKTVTVVDWSKVPVGTKCEIKVGNTVLTGRIAVDEDDDICLCHNNQKHQEGYSNVMLEYKYSYPLIERLAQGRISVVSLTLDPAYTPPLRVFINENIVRFCKDFIQVGCQKIPNSDVKLIAANLIDK